MELNNRAVNSHQQTPRHTRNRRRTLHRVIQAGLFVKESLSIEFIIGKKL